MRPMTYDVSLLCYCLNCGPPCSLRSPAAIFISCFLIFARPGSLSTLYLVGSPYDECGMPCVAGLGLSRQQNSSNGEEGGKWTRARFAPPRSSAQDGGFLGIPSAEAKRSVCGGSLLPAMPSKFRSFASTTKSQKTVKNTVLWLFPLLQG